MTANTILVSTQTSLLRFDGAGLGGLAPGPSC